MAGHSHWAKIKRTKAVVDARRGRLWSKLARDIIMAARHGGGDPDMNARLRLAIDKAKAANMPRDTIENAVKKGTGELAGQALEEVLYEGYGPGGVAIMCHAVTDNRTRTAPEIKKIFERYGGNFGAANSVAWMFKLKGVLTVAAAAVEEDRLIEITLEHGAEDVVRDADSFEVTCPPEAFEAVKKGLETSGITVQSADLQHVASSTVTLDTEKARTALKLLEALDEHDDVQSVSSNMEISDAVMATL
jgi:YebC/PmpR family DNA-binding regulatory protein